MKRRVWLSIAAVTIVAAVVFITTNLSEPVLGDPPVLTIGADADPELARTITGATNAVLADRSSRPRWVKLAMVYQANQMLTESVQCYEHALSMNGDDVRSWYYLAVVRSYGGDLDGAVQAMRRSTAISASYGPAHRRLGQWLIDLDELDEARREFTIAIELDSNDADAWIGLARLALKADRLEEAAQILQRITSAPGSRAKHAFQLLGTVYQRMGRTEEAQRLLQHSRTLEPVDRDVWLTAVNQYRAGLEPKLENVKQLVLQRRFDDAIGILKSLEERYPKAAVIPNNLGIVYRAQGRLNEAAKEFERATQRNEMYLEAHYNLAMNCVLESASADEPQRTTLLESAQRHLEQTLTINPSYGPAVALAGSVLKQRGDLELALSRFREAARLEPEQPRWLHSAGEMLRDLGRYEQAIDVLEQVISSAPYFTQAYFTLADAFAALGRIEQARATLQLVAQRQPNHPGLAEAMQRLNIDLNLSPPNGVTSPNRPGN